MASSISINRRETVNNAMHESQKRNDVKENHYCSVTWRAAALYARWPENGNKHHGSATLLKCGCGGVRERRSKIFVKHRGIKLLLYNDQQKKVKRQLSGVRVVVACGVRVFLATTAWLWLVRNGRCEINININEKRCQNSAGVYNVRLAVYEAMAMAAWNSSYCSYAVAWKSKIQWYVR